MPRGRSGPGKKLARDLSALREGLCTPEEEAKCLEEIGWERGQEMACGRCKTRRPADLDPYTLKLLRLRRMQNGGYPFRPNDLTIEEWIDLGRINEVLSVKF